MHRHSNATHGTTKERHSAKAWLRHAMQRLSMAGHSTAQHSGGTARLRAVESLSSAMATSGFAAPSRDYEVL